MSKKTKIIIMSAMVLVILILAVGAYFFLKNKDSGQGAKIEAGLSAILNPISGKTLGEKIPKINPFDADVNPFSAYKNPFK